MSDLIERLRASRSVWSNEGGTAHWCPSDIENEAAAALAEAQAEIARLRDALEIVAAGPILGEPMARWINHMMAKARAALPSPHDQ